LKKSTKYLERKLKTMGSVASLYDTLYNGNQMARERLTVTFEFETEKYLLIMRSNSHFHQTPLAFLLDILEVLQ
jgi:hypothetical protein